ncbi:MAG: RNA polymerase sigma factor [Deltaproteobacteria bacterium]|nr:RNA polymerase sigma factor [Deltaproteobacteria bacterium]MBN2673426.1 RNA polymerase sigma factor [Deltaproteobacteria bacterium]
MSSANNIIPLSPKAAIAQAAAPDAIPAHEPIQAALRGDVAAKEQIYRNHVRYVYAVALRLLRNQSDTEDVVQETFIQAFAELHRLRDPERFRAWLTQIAVHKVHRMFRKRRMRIRLFGSSAPMDAPLCAQLVSHASGETRAEIALLEQQLNTLDDTVRMCWMLRHIEQFSISEIATAAGISPATVKRKLKLADERLSLQIGIDSGGRNDER